MNRFRAVYRQAPAALLLAVLPAAAFADSKGIVLPPATHTVGGGIDCDFGTLQAAINAADSGDSIHMISGAFLLLGGGVTVEDKSLSITGGYANCSASIPDPDNPTELVGDGSDSVVTVDTLMPGSRSVLFRHFVLSGGDGGAAKGGGVDLGGDALLHLDHVVVEDNQAQYGGGIRIIGGADTPTLRLSGGSRIGGTSSVDGGNNATQFGGGLHCWGGAQIELIDAAINFNTAVSGGGMYLASCDVSTPAPGGSGEGLAEIRGNRVLQSGAGVYAGSPSVVALDSTRQRPVRVTGNQADVDSLDMIYGSGGGFYLTDADLQASGVRIEENHAARGGGIYVTNTGSVDMDRGNPTGANCAEPIRCSTLSRNTASSSGGAIHSQNSIVDLRQTFIESNQANNTSVGCLSASLVVLASVQISGNVSSQAVSSELLYSNNSGLDFRNVSIALNDSVRVMRLENTSSAALSDSIFWEPGGAALLQVDGSSSVNASCLNASESGSIAAETHDPGFWFGSTPPPTIGPPPLLHLADDSPNLDACDAVPVPNPAFDAAGRPRVQDIGEVPDLAGPLDRGALEWQPPLFVDGFED
ncbi:MAG: hypothetical protein R3F01_06335 [Lysobacteraceae bacterium]